MGDGVCLWEISASLRVSLCVCLCLHFCLSCPCSTPFPASVVSLLGVLVTGPALCWRGRVSFPQGRRRSETAPAGPARRQRGGEAGPEARRGGGGCGPGARAREAGAWAPLPPKARREGGRREMCPEFRSRRPVRSPPWRWGHGETPECPRPSLGGSPRGRVWRRCQRWPQTPRAFAFEHCSPHHRAAVPMLALTALGTHALGDSTPGKAPAP